MNQAAGQASGDQQQRWVIGNRDQPNWIDGKLGKDGPAYDINVIRQKEESTSCEDASTNDKHAACHQTKNSREK